MISSLDAAVLRSGTPSSALADAVTASGALGSALPAQLMAYMSKSLSPFQQEDAMSSDRAVFKPVASPESEELVNTFGQERKPGLPKFVNAEELVAGWRARDISVSDDDLSILKRLVLEFTYERGEDWLNAIGLDLAFKTGALVKDADNHITVDPQALQRQHDDVSTALVTRMANAVVSDGKPNAEQFNVGVSAASCFLNADKGRVNWLIATFGDPSLGVISERQLRQATWDGALKIDMGTGEVTIDVNRQPNPEWKNGGLALYKGDDQRYWQDWARNTLHPPIDPVTGEMPPMPDDMRQDVQSQPQF